VAVVVPRAELSKSDTTTVGQEEEPRALVRRSHVSSAKPDGGAFVAFPLELGEDGGKSASCSPNVLPEEERRLALSGDADLLEEEPASVAVESPPLAGDGEVLAGRATSDAIHCATPRASVEGGDVVPERSLRQGLLFHPGHEAGRCVGFPLDVHHSAGGSTGGKVQPEVEPSSAAEEGSNAEGT